MNAAETWARSLSSAEVVLYRLVRDGFRVSVRDGRLKVGRYDGSGERLPDGLRNSVAAHKGELKRLLSAWNAEEVRGVFRLVSRGMGEIYPVGAGCDLSPYSALLNKAQAAADAGDWGGFRFALYLACKRGSPCATRTEGRSPSSPRKKR